MSLEPHTHRDHGIAGFAPVIVQESSLADSNPYLAEPRPALASPAESGVEELTTAECWRLVEASRLGRLALDASDGRPDVFPLNFLVHNGNLFVRSAAGAKLRSIAQNPAVAFEVDGADERFHWSVVIRANAERMDTDVEIEASGVLDLVSWNPTEKFDFVRLTPIAVTGRRFPRHPRRTPPRRDTSPAGLADPGVPRGLADSPPGDPETEHGKPQPIPHFAPLPH